MASVPPPDQSGVPRITRQPAPAYRARPGIPDEMVDPMGRVRPVWQDFITEFQQRTPEDIRMLFSRADRYLEDAGVFFHKYADGRSGEKSWPLSHVPLLIAEGEWAAITSGLVQRANLLEEIVADLYGANRLVANGHLPAELIAHSREWLRPMVGMSPASGMWLNCVAFELARNPNGGWWVLNDRAQAPSGLGFALQNRLALNRSYPGLLNDGKVLRQAAFFRAFRDMLRALRQEPDSEVGILTPGPLVDTYYEQAYIARYLGFMLLQGEDMVVRNGRLFVRTTEGLKPISVLWRRIDSSFVDPLELEPRSQLGTPALLSALRAGTLSVINMPGTGILEMRAMMAFHPRLSEALLGEELRIPNIPVTWCGTAEGRAYAKGNAARLEFSSAFATDLPFSAGERLRPEGDAEAWIDTEAGRIVAREPIALSTTPAWVGDRLEPRPMTLRVFLVRGRDGWQMMPGGFARIATSGDPDSIGIQQGGATADVWVMSDRPVVPQTMIAATATVDSEDRLSLPARAADNFFWLGRYLERSENILRLSRAYHERSGGDAESLDTPVIGWLADYLRWKGIRVEDGVPLQLLTGLSAAMTSAGAVRDRFSPDGWEALKDLEKTAARLRLTVVAGEDASRALRVLLRKVAGLSGLIQENMYRFDAWRFLAIGRALERAQNAADLLERVMAEDAPVGSLDFAIDANDSTLSHRRRYPLATSVASTASILVSDSYNPRAMLFQLDLIDRQLQELPGQHRRALLTPLMREVRRLRTELETVEPVRCNAQGMSAASAALARISNLIVESYFG